ncbi:MAG: hypothetical protein ACOCV2_02275 [Persicimonas sp.]
MTHSATITLAQREARTVRVELTEDGEALTLSEYDIEYLAVDDDDETVVELTEGNGLEVTDVDEGKLELAFSADDTDIDDGAYPHELWLRDGDDYAERVLQGDLRIVESHGPIDG